MATDQKNPALEDDLMSAFLDTSVSEDTIVKAEDIELGGGMNFSEIFFEPQIGKTYRIKFVKNPKGSDLSLRKVYKGLPDPERRGKTFQHVSSGVAATDPALQLFFDLHKLKKEGDALSEKIIKDYLSSTNQACSIVQVITSDDDAIKAGEFRLWQFSNFGPNATIANLIDSKVNPSAAEIEDGAIKQNIWNIFGSSIMLVQVSESNYDGNVGRDFTKSKWVENKIQGVSVKMEDESTYSFSEADNVDGKMRPEAIPAFRTLISILTRPTLSVHDYFSYKTVDDEKNTPETTEYLKKVSEKLSKIIPVIANAKSIEEIQAACAVDTSANNDTKEKNAGTNILAESIPDELKGSVIDQAASDVATSKPTTDSANSEASSILDGI